MNNMVKSSKTARKRSTSRYSITKLIKKIQDLDFKAESLESLSELLEIIETKS